MTAIDPYPSRNDSTYRFIERADPVVYASDEGSRGPLSSGQVRTFAEEGFLLLPGLFGPDVLQPIADEVERLREAAAGSRAEEVITEPDSGAVRSIFAVHRNSAGLRELCRHPRLAGAARQLLGGEVYIHQSRINFKPGFRGREFYWHSDFETWHVEDGMPRMRAVSCALSLTENTEFNGPLMLIPGSHRTFVTCVGETPREHYKASLKRQDFGVPEPEALARLVDRGGLRSAKGPPGTVLLFECNVMHGSAGNITPFPRSNVFTVYNSLDNTLVEPFGRGLSPRPEYIADREFTPLSAL